MTAKVDITPPNPPAAQPSLLHTTPHQHHIDSLTSHHDANNHFSFNIKSDFIASTSPKTTTSNTVLRMSQLATVPAGRFEPRQQLTAWETAKARFLENLDDNEKALFESATVENIFYSSSATEKQDARDSKFRTRLEKIQPLVATLNEYGKALDTYTQIEPLYLAPIWGSMRVVMALASAHSRFHGQVVEVLGNIGELLPRLRKFALLPTPSKVVP